MISDSQITDRAKDLYESDEIQIEEDARPRQADGGYWVTALVWVHEEELEAS